MSKAEQVLGLDPPNELRFRGPFTDVVTSELKLANPTERRVCFKVKTTAPKRYCVRPNSGIIEPRQEVSVAVMLQPFDYDPNEKNKHKFMVQTMFAPEGPIESQENLWKDVPPEQLMDSKLKCVFDMPVEVPVTAPLNNLDANISSEENLKANIKVTGTPEKSSPKASNVEADMRKAVDENKRLQADLQQLRDENSRLKNEDLRLRKLAVSDTVSSTPAATQHMSMSEPPAGLPPVVYVVIALIIGLIIGKFIL